jgi:hypothetical protein
MTARNKPSTFSGASERFATFLRTVPVENTETVRRDARRARFNADGHPLWTRTFESQWHRFLCKTTHPKIFH